MNDTPDDPAEALSELTWRRNFRLDTVTLARAFQKEISGFVSALRSETRRLQRKLHPSQKLVLDVETTFAIYVQEEGRSTPLASCFIDTSKAGTVAMCFQGDEVEERRLTATLECYAAGANYWWKLGSSGPRTSNEPLANACLECLLGKAVEVVEMELRSSYEQGPLSE